MQAKSLRLVIAAAIAAVVLSSCTIYVRPYWPSDSGVELSGVIQDFRPTRGSGATYFVGESIEFMLRTTTSGYVTLTAIDPDGRVYVLARNVFVEGGRNILPTPSQRVTYSAGTPRGFHRVRASFTSNRTSESSVSYQGIYGEGNWTSSISVDIRPSPVRDVSETTLYIR
ncbi:MAG: DUF4384 domain-containing protein [Trueperaceae bacterium]|nr:DUF4384 domain-containing protein [Trueperaceae bacterium]